MNQDYYILSNYISFQRNQMIAIENILNLFVSINEQTERILNRYYERNQTTTNIRRRSNRSDYQQVPPQHHIRLQCQ